MNNGTTSVLVFCGPKQRHVQIEIAVNGPWFNRSEAVKFCPAAHDAGDTCDHSCIDNKALPADFRLAPTSPWTTRRWI